MKKYDLAARIRALLAADLPGLHRLTLDETRALLTAIEARLG